jgi:cytochrome c-type biogenesis protein CcmH/NrfG
VLELDPANSTAKEYLAKTQALLAEEISTRVAEATRLESQKKYGDALSKWREVLQLDPEHSQAKSGVSRITLKIEEAHHINLGFEYFTSGNFDEAASEFKAALALNPENRTAVEYLRRSVGRKSLIEIAGDREVWRLYLKGIEHFTNGEYEEAIEVWEEVLRLDPQNENAVRNIEEARLRLRKGTEESGSNRP